MGPVAQGMVPLNCPPGLEYLTLIGNQSKGLSRYKFALGHAGLRIRIRIQGFKMNRIPIRPNLRARPKF
jgi:hypothetical protein